MIPGCYLGIWCLSPTAWFDVTLLLQSWQADHCSRSKSLSALPLHRSLTLTCRLLTHGMGLGSDGRILGSALVSFVALRSRLGVG